MFSLLKKNEKAGPKKHPSWFWQSQDSNSNICFKHPKSNLPGFLSPSTLCLNTELHFYYGDNKKHVIIVFFKPSRCLQRFQQAGVYCFSISQVSLSE
jgi:hypothetical protein